MPIHESPLLLEEQPARSVAAVGGWKALLMAAGLFGGGAACALVKKDLVFSEPAVMLSLGWIHGAAVVLFVGGVILAVRGAFDLWRAWRFTHRHPSEADWELDYRWDRTGISTTHTARLIDRLVTAGMIAIVSAPLNWWAFDSGAGFFIVQVGAWVFNSVVALLVIQGMTGLLGVMFQGQPRLRFERFPLFLGMSQQVHLDDTRFLKSCRSLSATVCCIEEACLMSSPGDDDIRGGMVCFARFTDKQVIERSRWQTNGIPLTIRFELPKADLATRLSARPPRYWTLTLEDEGREVAEFLLPVYHPRPPYSGDNVFDPSEPCEIAVSPRSIESSVGVYGLTILGRLLARCRTLPELLQAIAAYPEDVQREGRIKAGLTACVAAFTDFELLAKTVQSEIARHGGQASLDEEQDDMDRDEFLSGWEEK